MKHVLVHLLTNYDIDLAEPKGRNDLIGRDGMAMKISLRTLRYADERVRLYNEQGPGDSGLSRTYMDAAQVAIAKGDLARGRIFAQRAVDGWRASGGSDSEQVVQHGDLCENPAKLPLYGLNMGKTLLDLNDRVQHFATVAAGRRTCHGCHTQASDLTKCAGCSMFWYCGKVCQKTGWKGKRHRVDCKMLKDTDLRGLLGLKWIESETRADFPLAVRL